MRNLMFLADIVLIFSGWAALGYAERQGLPVDVVSAYIVLGVISVMGTLPRRVFLGKKKLSGWRNVLFDGTRALAVASPNLMLVKQHPVAGILALFLTAAVIEAMRRVARQIYAKSADMKARNYIPEHARALQIRFRKANSFFLVCASLCVFLMSVAINFADWPVICAFAAPVIGCCLTMILFLASYECHKSAETRFYDMHCIDYVLVCADGAIRDAIHYAGGPIQNVSDISKSLEEQGRGSVVLSRDLSSHNRALKAGFKSYLVKTLADLDHFIQPSLENIHYSGNTLRAGHVVRFRDARHILHLKQIPSSPRGFPEYLAMYDALVTRKMPDKKQSAHAKWLGITLLSPKLQPQG